MTTQINIDQARAEAFVGTVITNVTGTVITLISGIGEKLGLFKSLYEGGPATSAEFAARAGINERYAREWLGALTNAGYFEYDPATQRYCLPEEHAPVLVQEGGPVFLAGIFQELLGLVPNIPQVTNAFRTGGGVPIEAYGDDWWQGLERFTNGWFENLLLPVWIPLMPDVQAKLEQGAVVADVGCGGGRGLIKLAQAFPNSRFTGYDLVPAQIERARAAAEAAGVADRVSFIAADVTRGLTEQYDVITTFDVIHDAVNPRGLLRGIRECLKPDGIYVCLDINCSDKQEENIGPVGAMMQGISMLFCMTVSLAEGGEGLGTVGLPESKLRELATEAGFSSVRRVEMENPFNNLYEVRA